jgi:CDGSH-type Zn-finger protein
MTPDVLSDVDFQVRSLLQAADRLASELAGADDEASHRVGTRLRDSVARPLRQVVTTDAVQTGDRDSSLSTEGQIWQLARAATGLLVQLRNAPELAEATAALQDLALGLATEADAAQRLAELEALQAGLEQRIQVAHNGPHIVTNAHNLLDYRGRPLPVRPTMALCRCGASTIKPFCDGIHAEIGFTDAKDPKRVPDRRDSYAGRQMTVLDNRGTCQHSGFCTDRLAAVFHLGQDPFATPDDGRMEDIIRAVRGCPSGALSYAVDGVEARDDVDHHGEREPAIQVSKDGPYRVTGSIPLVDHVGEDMARNQGASHEHYALCRCGHSQNKPFCSGMHWYVDFRDPVEDGGEAPASATAAAPSGAEHDVAPPAAGEPVSFEEHIKPLFRERDRKSMSFAFDLWSCDDVKLYAEAILQRLQNGSMPCDGAWPDDRVELFQRWIEGGKLS